MDTQDAFSMDQNQFIDPAQLSSPTPNASFLPYQQASPYAPIPHPITSRGVKRSRSPEDQVKQEAEDKVDAGAVGAGATDEDSKPRKRGRPTKSKTDSISIPSPAAPLVMSQTSVVQTPARSQAVTQESPSQASPPQSTPSKSARPLPVARDHTTDKLTADGDEYEPRDIDEAGELKITKTGALTGGRQYIPMITPFTLRTRGDKLFMLATRCAQGMSYRDSYLLFNKNKSLYKLMANQKEKEEMIEKNVIPYAYRSRQIAIVTARSMFRHFGARTVKDGHKVRDDYFEERARALGFTEDDPQWLRKPGDPRQVKETVHVPPVSNDISSIGQNAMHQLGDRTVVYEHYGQGQSQFPPTPPLDTPGLFMPNLDADDMRPRDYGDLQRPRQEMTGIPYTDRIAPSSDVEVVNQAAQATQFNAQIRQQRNFRFEYLNNEWHKPHEVEELPALEPQVTGGTKQEQLQQSTYISPQAARSTPAVNIPLQQPNMSQTPASMLQPGQFARPQNSSMQPSPSPSVHGLPNQLGPQQQQRQQYPNFNPAQQQIPNFANYQTSMYGAGTPSMAPHASPMQQPQMSQYGGQMSGPSPSPHPSMQSPHPGTMQQPSQMAHGVIPGYPSGGIPNFMGQQGRMGMGGTPAGMMRPGTQMMGQQQQMGMGMQGMQGGGYYPQAQQNQQGWPGQGGY